MPYAIKVDDRGYFAQTLGSADDDVQGWLCATDIKDAKTFQNRTIAEAFAEKLLSKASENLDIPPVMAVVAI